MSIWSLYGSHLAVIIVNVESCWCSLFAEWHLYNEWLAFRWRDIERLLTATDAIKKWYFDTSFKTPKNHAVTSCNKKPCVIFGCYPADFSL